MEDVPVIDVSALVRGEDDHATGDALDAAARDLGFFYVVGHGVDEDAQVRLEALAHELFALDPAAKAACSMDRGGVAWRGWFPLGGELTSGRPDAKEGWYFGAELGPDHPRVEAGTPLHGPNVFPPELPALRQAVLDHLTAMTSLGHAVLRGLALGLGLDPGWFDDHLTNDPLILFRIFRYPPSPTTPGPDTEHPRRGLAGVRPSRIGGGGSEATPGADEQWGVAEHTDYGLLTMLRQDATGGLQVHAPSGWIDAPPVPGSFVCNLGDMLERMTGGRYRSTPHRVRNSSAGDRLSFPFFFDPDWDAEVVPVPDVAGAPTPERRPRWDGSDVQSWEGTYGEYLLSRVGKVFPDLGEQVLHPDL